MPFKIDVSNIEAITPTTHILHKNIINIGRDSQNELVVAQSNVSRQHAVLQIDNGVYLLEDCDSKYGTYYYDNDKWDRLSGSKIISMPAIIMLGENILIRIEHFLVTLDESTETIEFYKHTTAATQTIHDKEKAEGIMVLDLCDSSKLANQNEELAYLLKLRLNQLSIPILYTKNARFLKGTGDGFVATFQSAEKTLEAAAKIVTKIEERNRESRNIPIQYRIALNFGKVYFTDSAAHDIHGNAVNITFRIEGVKANQFTDLQKTFPDNDRILCTSEFLEELNKGSSVDDMEFSPCGAIKVKGIAEPVEVYCVWNQEKEQGKEQEEDGVIKLTVYL